MFSSEFTADPEAKTIAMVLIGGEEGIETPLQSLFRHATAAIGYSYDNTFIIPARGLACPSHQIAAIR